MYDYDAFGAPIRGSFSGGLNIGYAGKQFDRITGMYNYGYRDYAPSEARFTSLYPIRDGINWFSYVHNDPVNYVDLWGLKANEPKPFFATDVLIPTITIATQVNLFDKVMPTMITDITVQKTVAPSYFLQNDWSALLGQAFSNSSCAATTIINVISEIYTSLTGSTLSWYEANVSMQTAVNAGSINNGNLPVPAFINDWASAANDMWQWGNTMQTGTFTYNAEGEYQIYARDADRNLKADHFLNSTGAGQYRDPWNGNIGNVENIYLQQDRETRGFDFIN
jgi:RHS repeat-associated protein